jgi:diacylglycerol kinase family enzyme
MSRRWLAIVNPRAGHTRPAVWRARITQRLHDQLDAEVVFTERPGHAEELARASNADGIAVFGGDGTIAEVINGMHLEKQSLLPLPGGTGNGLARDLGLTSLDAAVNAAREGRIRALDLIRVDFRSGQERLSRLAISTASVGYAAEVVVLANRYFKRFGNLCYPLSATLQAARQGEIRLNVSIDGGQFIERRLSNVMVNNTRHAGNFRAFRASDLSDGRMEVLMARAGFASQFLHNLAVLSKTYFYRTAAEITARRIELALYSPQRLMMDGELWKNVSEASFESLPGKLKCIA